MQLLISQRAPLVVVTDNDAVVSADVFQRHLQDPLSMSPRALASMAGRKYEPGLSYLIDRLVYARIAVMLLTEMSVPDISPTTETTTMHIVLISNVQKPTYSRWRLPAATWN